MQSRRSEIIRGLKVLPELIKEVLKLDGEVLKLSEQLYKQKSVLVMGRGYNHATCMEGALVSTWGFLSCLGCFGYYSWRLERDGDVWRDYP